MERVGGSCDVVVSLSVEQIKLLDQVQKKKKTSPVCSSNIWSFTLNFYCGGWERCDKKEIRNATASGALVLILWALSGTI